MDFTDFDASRPTPLTEPAQAPAGVSAKLSISSVEHTALLARIDLLAATSSVAETLDLTVELLGEIGLTITSLRLDRNGFTTLWERPRAQREHSTELNRSDVSLSVCSANTGTTTLEARYRGSLSNLAERAVNSFLNAAAIQTERLSRRVWQYPSPEKVEAGSRTGDESSKTSSRLSEKARKLEADIERVARFPHGILITGETGTGKTRAAREIHRRSARAGKPFVELNCAVLPEQLVEAELFGYRKGAFTGADRDHKGLFEEADGGIVFLDEIGDLPPAIQNKLLKAIDEKQIKRLGTNHYVRCDVQVIAATSRDLRAMVRRGEFREDLYCRLAVLKIEAVPLRERREDIPALIDTFLREAAETVSRLSGQTEEYQIEIGAVEMLCAHHWSGNVRVLRNTIFELTSYVHEGETITMERVGEALAWLNDDAKTTDPAGRDGADVAVEKARGNLYSSPQLAEALQTLAQEGDIVLPLEVCLLRRGETLKQWAARVKQLSIEATCRASDAGTMRGAAARLGLSHGSLKGHLHRARCAS